MLASAISARPVVRDYLLDMQRNLAKEKNAVFEGRDMGTVVFPDADLKFFLNASARTRALRRYDELKSKSTLTLEEVGVDIQRRDRNDSTRELAPLKPAQDAIMVDSTDLSVTEVVELMVSHVVE
jgi:cytidylate kinase